MLDGNIFREARQLLQDKPMLVMNGEELITVKAAMIPLNILPQFNDIPIDEGLEKLAKMWDEASQAEADHIEETVQPSTPSVLENSPVTSAMMRCVLKRITRPQTVALGCNDHLTPREVEVLRLAARMNNRDIAGYLGIAERTVKGHLTNIFSKINVGSRTEAVVEALKQGWISQDE